MSVLINPDGTYPPPEGIAMNTESTNFISDFFANESTVTTVEIPAFEVTVTPAAKTVLAATALVGIGYLLGS